MHYTPICSEELNWCKILYVIKLFKWSPSFFFPKLSRSIFFIAPTLLVKRRVEHGHERLWYTQPNPLHDTSSTVELLNNFISWRHAAVKWGSLGSCFINRVKAAQTRSRSNLWVHFRLLSPAVIHIRRSVAWLGDQHPGMEVVLEHAGGVWSVLVIDWWRWGWWWCRP